MKRYTKHFTLLALLVGCSLVFSGCLQTKITTGNQPSNQEAQLAWAHGFVYGLVPPVNGPLDVGNQCTNGVSEVDFRQTFVQWLAQGVTWSLYAPQQFTVTCASSGATSSVDTPPAYLLRDGNSGDQSMKTASAE